MIKSLIVLKDGTELYSGIGNSNAIQSVTVTESVNSNQELTLGSTCATEVVVNILAPNGGVDITADDEFTLYRVTEDSTRYPVGIFRAEKPTRPSANSLKLTAYDRVSRLDKDLTLWLEKLDKWPYTLIAFARAVCEACDLELVEDSEEELPNNTYQIQQFSADGITGRKLMQWIGEICGRFCRATVDGKIELAWYTPATTSIVATQIDSAVVDSYNGNISIRDPKATSANQDFSTTINSDNIQVSDDGNGNVVLQLNGGISTQYYFQNELSFEDFVTMPIEKVQLQQNEEDVGTVYPDDAQALNTYKITGNYLLTARYGDDLVPVAQALYEHLSTVQPYTPCKVSIPTTLLIRAGHTVTITDRNGKVINMYVMKRVQSGQRDTLECTGSMRRDSSAAVNNQSFQAYVGKVLNLRTDVDGLKVQNADTAGRVATLELNVEGINTLVSQQSTDLSGVQTKITELNQKAGSIEASVTSIVDNGVTKVSNKFGLLIDESAVQIQREGSDMTNRLDEKGMQVIRGSGEYKTVMLKADSEGVIATDVSVRNYLIVGDHARFEDYSRDGDTQRTACFWLGG